MNPSLERFGLRVMSGEARGVGPAMLRGALALAEPFYAGAMIARNRLYDVNALKRHPLPRPVVSVGNLTAGGTGKTPVVRWLAEQLIARGRRPAVLLRGYGQRGASFSDEQQLLQSCLDSVPVIANPDRRAGAASALEQQPQIDVLLLDDAFQHRKVRRHFDLVLINAADPFGFGHVHPRGLLREPLRGLKRADAILLTRVDAVDSPQLDAIETKVRSVHPSVPIFRSMHVLTGLKYAASSDHPITALNGQKFFSFAGIGSPQAFHRQLIAAGGLPVGSRWFPDHHPYTEADVATLSRQAASAGANVMLTTEKDWVKLAHLRIVRESTPPVARVQMRIEFQRADDESALLDAVMRGISVRV